MNTCRRRRNAGENKRGPELEDGREITGSSEKEGDYPRFFRSSTKEEFFLTFSELRTVSEASCDCVLDFSGLPGHRHATRTRRHRPTYMIMGKKVIIWPGAGKDKAAAILLPRAVCNDCEEYVPGPLCAVARAPRGHASPSPSLGVRTEHDALHAISRARNRLSVDSVDSEWRCVVSPCQCTRAGGGADRAAFHRFSPISGTINGYEEAAWDLKPPRCDSCSIGDSAILMAMFFRENI